MKSNWHEAGHNLVPLACKWVGCLGAFAVGGPVAAGVFAYSVGQLLNEGSPAGEALKAIAANLNGLMTHLYAERLQRAGEQRQVNPVEKLFCRTIQLILTKARTECPGYSQQLDVWSKALNEPEILPSSDRNHEILLYSQGDRPAFDEPFWPDIRSFLESLTLSQSRDTLQIDVAIPPPLDRDLRAAFMKYSKVSFEEAMVEPESRLAWQLCEQEMFRRISLQLAEVRLDDEALRTVLTEVRSGLNQKLDALMLSLQRQQHIMASFAARLESRLDRVDDTLGEIKALLVTLVRRSAADTSGSYPQILTATHPILQPRHGVFEGREWYVQELVDELARPQPEILSLEGAPGIGKTEIAKASMRRYLNLYPYDQAFFLDMKEVATYSGFTSTCAQALGQPRNVTPEDCPTFLASLASLRRTLIHFNNFETVALLAEAERDKAFAFVRRLADTAGVRVIVSCREALPGFAQPIRVGSLPEDAAVKVFHKLASRIGNVVVPENSPELSSFVMNDLSGHPLSIALTAAQARNFSLDDLIREWEGAALDLAEASGEHETLRSLRRSLTFSLRAILSTPLALETWLICALPIDGLSNELWLRLFDGDTARRLAKQRLLDAHLVEHRHGRYYLLGPVREFIIECARLGLYGLSLASTVSPLLATYLHWIHQAEPLASQAIRRELRLELSNITRIFRLALETNSESAITGILEGSRGLGNVVILDPLRAETLIRLIREIAEVHGSPGQRAHAWLDSARLALLQGRTDQARACCERAWTFYESMSSPLGKANVLMCLGEVNLRLLGLSDAEQNFKQAQILYEGLDAQHGLATTYRHLGDIAQSRRDHFHARHLYSKALLFMSRTGDSLGAAQLLLSLASLEARLKQDAQANVYLTKAHELSTSVGDPHLQANVFRALAELDGHAGFTQTAEEHYQRALVLYQEMGDPFGEAEISALLADLKCAQCSWFDAMKNYRLAAEAFGLIPGARAHHAEALAALAFCEHATQNLDWRAHLKEAQYIASSSHSMRTLAYVKTVADAMG